MISTEPDLHHLLDKLADLDRVAFDTEADSLHCYFEKLCLIQLSFNGCHELVDPLAPVSLQALFDALGTKEVVFHGADYDLRLLERYGVFRPARLFDTMIAARLAGSAALGLAALVEKHFGVQLCKASQKANWALRPLPAKMEEYAINDTRYLLQLADILSAELERLGRMDWFHESVERMIVSARNPKERDDTDRWRIKGTTALPPRARAIAREIWLWRDAEARAWDRPPFHVMGNSAILAVATAAAEGRQIPRLRLPKTRRERFEAMLAQALEIPESDWPEKPRPTGQRSTREEVRRFDALKRRRDKIAAGLGLDPSIIAPKAALESASADENTSALMRWQRALLDLPPLQS